MKELGADAVRAAGEAPVSVRARWCDGVGTERSLGPSVVWLGDWMPRKLPQLVSCIVSLGPALGDGCEGRRKY